MNKIPENENINDDVSENVTESTENTESDFSTVFSAPAVHEKSSNDIKKKKLLPKITAAFLSVAVLIGGTFAVIKFIPEKEDDSSSTPTIENIEVLSLDSNDFKTVTVTNSNGTFKLYSEVKESDSSDSSDSTSTVTWYMEGYDDGILDSTSISSIADSVAVISASREVTQKIATDCGLEKPTVKADVLTAENEEFSVLLGNESPDKSGYYLKLSNSDKIYVVESTLMETLNFTDVSLANTNIMPSFPLEDVDKKYLGDDSLLTSCDKITLTGENFSEPLVIEPYDFEELNTYYSTFKITSPTKRVAENVDGIFEIFKSGVTVSGAYALDVSAKTLKFFGLDTPYLTVTMEIGKEKMTFKFSPQADGSYAAVCDGAVIVKKVDAEAIPFINYKTSDYFSDWICLNNIGDLKQFTFRFGDNSYTFDIKANPDEESESPYIVTLNGNSIDCESFQDFYQDCIALTCSDFTSDKLSGEPDYSLVFTFKDDIGGKQTVEFTRYSETKYQCNVDGITLGKLTAASLKKLETSLETLLNK